MKRIILLIVITLVQVSLFSQSTHFTFAQKMNGTWHLVPNGSSITFSMNSSAANYESTIAVRNETSSFKQLYLRKFYVKRNTQSFMDIFCWDVCYTDPNVMVSKYPVDFKALTTDSISFHITYFPQGHDGETIVRYKMWDKSDFNDSAYITIHYVSSQSGVPGPVNQESVSFSPNPCNSTVTFTIPENNRGKTVIHLFDLLGKELKQIPVQTGENSVRADVSAFPAGIYLFYAETDGVKSNVKKLLIQR